MTDNAQVSPLSHGDTRRFFDFGRGNARDLGEILNDLYAHTSVPLGYSRLRSEEARGGHREGLTFSTSSDRSSKDAIGAGPSFL